MGIGEGAHASGIKLSSAVDGVGGPPTAVRPCIGPSDKGAGPVTTNGGAAQLPAAVGGGGVNRPPGNDATPAWRGGLSRECLPRAGERGGATGVVVGETAGTAVGVAKDEGATGLGGVARETKGDGLAGPLGDDRGLGDASERNSGVGDGGHCAPPATPPPHPTRKVRSVQ